MTPSQPMAEVAAEMRRLGDALIQSKLDAVTAEEIRATLAEIRRNLDAAPRHSKFENFGLRNRVMTFLETGAWPDPPVDGGRLDFDPASVVGGEFNPFGMGAKYFREGDEAVGRVTVGHCFEGPPDRVHGGMIAAVFDEVFGSVFRATGVASAFTGELSVRFEAPAPVGVELEFRGRLVGTEGRKRFLSGEARSPDGPFASATATFIEMRPEQFVTD